MKNPRRFTLALAVTIVCMAIIHLLFNTYFSAEPHTNPTSRNEPNSSLEQGNITISPIVLADEIIPVPANETVILAINEKTGDTDSKDSINDTAIDNIIPSSPPASGESYLKTARNAADASIATPAYKATLPPLLKTVNAPAVAATSTSRTSSIPDEFLDLAAPQASLIDFYYGNRFITSSQAVYTPDSITITNPAELVKRIPDIANPAAVQSALTGEISAHVSAICFIPGETDCGSISPQVAGVIFNADRFRADIFIAEPYLKTRSIYQSKYLPESHSSLGLIQGLSAATSGVTGTGNNQENYSLFGNTLVGWRENHLISDWDYTKENHFSVDTLYAERDAQGLQFGAGYLNTNGVMAPEFSSTYKLLGLKAGSSTNSRLDTAEINATPIRLFSNGPRRVEVLRDNRLIYATSIEAGSQEVNTASFPDGAYNITIRIYNGATLEQEITRFYVKSVKLPPADEILWYLEGGEITSREGNTTLPDTQNDWLIRGGAGFRIAENTALNVKSSVTEHDHLAEAELYHQGDEWDATATMMAGNNSAKGAAFQTSAPLGPFHFSYYYRRLWNDNFQTENADSDNDPETRLLGSSYENHSLSASTQFLGGSLSGSYSYSQNDDSDKQTIKSLSWYTNLVRFSDHDLDLQLNYSQDEDDKIATAGLTLRRSARNWNYSARSNSRWEKNSTGERETSHEHSLDARWYYDEILNGSGELGVNYDNQTDQNILGTDISFDTARFQMDASADYVKPDNNDSNSYTSYTGSLQTSFAMNANYIGLGGGSSSDSALLINIEGSQDALFDVLVNGSQTGIASGDSTTVVPVSPYDTYRVSIRSRGNGFYDYDQGEKEVTLYPGNVESLTFKSHEEIVLLGKLVDDNGEALGSARIRNQSIFTQTDKYGIFQIRIPSSDTSLNVELADATSCTAWLPESYQKRGGVGMVGELSCSGEE